MRHTGCTGDCKLRVSEEVGGSNVWGSKLVLYALDRIKVKITIELGHGSLAGSTEKGGL